MKYFNISTKKTFDQNGAQKTVWLSCGTMRETEDGKRFIELNMFPNTSFYVFEQKPKTKETTVEDIEF